MRFLAALLLLIAPVTGSSDPNTVVDGWKTSPVYVDPSQSSVVPDKEAAKLAERVKDHDPAIRIAVLPAESLDDGRRDKQMSAQAYMETVVYKQAADGIYLVVFGDLVTRGSAVGVDTAIDPVLTEELRKHGRSDPVRTLNGVLDQLGVPKASSGLPGWLVAFLITVGVLVAAGLGWWWWRSRRDTAEGPAPSGAVLDEAVTLEERRAQARDDVTTFGAELDAAEVLLDGHADNPDALADVQAAKAAYAAAGRVLDGKPDDDQLRGVRATVGYGRWRLACARARIEGKPVPPWRALGRPQGSGL
ncbi:hypothetical protein AB0F43_34610 [Kribbella sp. NPDC023972]|uniref:hypothetical protein n=1 Tax=Kribbella sp. NPDC023972 TaxID=3154795 RepID=UPI003407A86D